MMKKLFVGTFCDRTGATPAAWAQAGRPGILKKAIEANWHRSSWASRSAEGTSDSVRSFGKQLEQDHSAANTKAMNWRKRWNDATDRAHQKQKADYDRMSQLSGDKFDSMFVKT